MELVNVTLVDLLNNTVKIFPQNVALVCEDKSFTWDEVDSISDNIAMKISFMGVHPNNHVGILSADSVEMFFFILAVLKAGAVCVMLNPGATVSELCDMQKIGKVDFLGYGSEFKGEKIPEKVHQIKEIPMGKFINIEETVFGNYSEINCVCERKDKLNAIKSNISPQDNAFILFTSGTTGSPKAVMTTHFMRSNNAIIQGMDIALSCKDKVCVAIPMFHCFSLSANIFSAISTGATIIIPRDRHTQSICIALKKGCTVLNAVPTLFNAIIKSNSFSKECIYNLRVGLIGGASCSREQFIDIENALEFTLLPSLGQTEATAGITVCNINDSIEIRSATLGRFMEHIDGCIKDINTKEILPVNLVGEICVKGYSIMNGYYNHILETINPIDNNDYLHTGDLGFLDENNYLHYAGRLKQLIIRGGENISPYEIEQSILKSGLAILDVQVVGIDDSHYGEEICACIVATENISEDLIKEKVGTMLSAYKVPKYICFLNEFPTTSGGKISKIELKKIVKKIVEENNSEIK